MRTPPNPPTVTGSVVVDVNARSVVVNLPPMITTEVLASEPTVLCVMDKRMSEMDEMQKQRDETLSKIMMQMETYIKNQKVIMNTQKQQGEEIAKIAQTVKFLESRSTEYFNSMKNAPTMLEKAQHALETAISRVEKSGLVQEGNVAVAMGVGEEGRRVNETLVSAGRHVDQIKEKRIVPIHLRKYLK